MTAKSECWYSKVAFAEIRKFEKEKDCETAKPTAQQRTQQQCNQEPSVQSKPITTIASQSEFHAETQQNRNELNAVPRQSEEVPVALAGSAAVAIELATRHAMKPAVTSTTHTKTCECLVGPLSASLRVFRVWSVCVHVQQCERACVRQAVPSATAAPFRPA